MGDTGSPLFAAVEGWAFPASMPELLQLAVTAGEGAERVMPWTLGAEARRREALRVSPEEVAAGLAEIDALVGH